MFGSPRIVPWARLRAGIARRVAPLLGELRGTSEVDLQHAPIVCLSYDAQEALPALRHLGPVRVEGAIPPALAAADPGLGAARAVLVHPLRELKLKDAWRVVRAGAREFHLVHAPGQACQAGAVGTLAIASAREVERWLEAAPRVRRWASVVGLRVGAPWASSASTLRALEVARRSQPVAHPLRSGPLRVVHWVPSLPAGGAERQLVYLARAQRARGWVVRVLTSLPLDGSDAHYAAQLRQEGVEVRHLVPWPRWRPVPGGSEPLDVCAAHAAGPEILALYHELVTDPPDVLHGWLDEANATAAMAGLLAGTARIVLSTWNVNPSWFPRLHKPWFADSYRLSAGHPRVRLVANSRGGADDYARWADISPALFQVIPNGLAATEWVPLSSAERASGREQLGIPADAFLIGGVFRLDQEKRPLDFLEVITRVRRSVPTVRGIHLGAGPLADEVQARARALDLTDVVTFMGRVERPRDLLGLCDTSLLTSRVEGSPNVSQESQLLEVPIVLTRVVGSPETIVEGVTGTTAAVGDVEAMAGALVALAGDPARRRAMGRAGREWVEAEFSLQRLEERTEELYRG